MKNVAKRMLNNDMARAIIAWRSKSNAHVRAERIMKRVGGRWMHGEMSNAFENWQESHAREKARLHAEVLMRRVGNRLQNKQVALNFAEFERNAKNDREIMWRNRVAKLQVEVDSLQMKFTLVTQVMKQTMPHFLNQI